MAPPLVERRAERFPKAAAFGAFSFVLSLPRDKESTSIAIRERAQQCERPKKKPPKIHLAPSRYPNKMSPSALTWTHLHLTFLSLEYRYKLPNKNQSGNRYENNIHPGADYKGT